MALAEPPTIETARLRVRRVRPADLPALLKVNGSDEVTAMLPYATWHSLADAEAWLDRMKGIEASGSALQLVVAEKSGDTAIGTCLLFRHDEGSARAELGYVLGREHWGKGLMREALAGVLDASFGPMHLRRIEAEVDVRNAASSRLLEGLGFSLEGVLRQRWISKGEAKDMELFGLLSHEWRHA